MGQVTGARRYMSPASRGENASVVLAEGSWEERAGEGGLDDKEMYIPG